MSIAVAVRKGNEIVLAADSQSNFGSHRAPLANHRAAKIREVGGSYLATTGWGLYENILDDFLARRGVPRLGTKPQIFSFFMKLWKELHDRYSYVNDQPDKEDDTPFGDLAATFLLVNKGGIHLVSSDMSVTEFDQYYAVGSGADFSLGALHALYESELDAEELARRAVDAAISFNIYCGGEAEAKKIKLGAGRPKAAKRPKK